MLLDSIQKANDIKKIKEKDLDSLAAEIRQFLIEKISVSGGHLGSNLGAVELTMALHLSLDLPTDKIVWDVGHQSYTHKILTGRREGFETLRKFGGMSGFPKRKESDCDSFDTGHSSTSISAGLGLAQARDLLGERHTVVFIVILNDNNMSISENVGGVSTYLNSIRTDAKYLDLKDSIYYRLLEMPKYGQAIVKKIQNAKNGIKQLMIPGMFFEDMGIKYLGPVDGHDIKALRRVITEAKRVKGAVIIHVITQKGRGYTPAERHPARFHGAEPFDIETGIPKNPHTKANYTDVFATVMNKMAEKDDKLVAITAAMPDGTGLKRFRNRYPERFFDVGIAEEHAVTFAAGLAAGGLRPVVAIYSSFLQRAYDQILHDVCIQNLPVTFAIDRAGLVGSDGETHQGIFDFSFLSSIPNMHIMAPKNKWELADMMKYAVSFEGPIAIRYPRGEAYDGLEEYRQPIAYGKAEWIYQEKEIALVAVGSMVKTAEQVRLRLKEEGYADCSLLNARFVKPIDEETILDAAGTHSLLVTMEENVLSGGFSEKVIDLMEANGNPAEVLPITLPDEYVEHGNVELLKKEVGIDTESIVRKILATLKNR